ncbi:MAG: helicase-related protein, partial [Gemmatimonadales bacterium]
IDRLEFPGCGDPRTGMLLRLHLMHRLSSSTAALRQSVTRHLAYLDRAQAAAVAGETLTRSTARRLFGPNDELQLELGHLLPTPAHEAPAAPTFERERQRLLELLDMLAAQTIPNPKAERLVTLLRQRHNRKTIVFTAAESTALDLARHIGWERIAVVASGKARVASGPIAVEQALELFAPRARGAPEPATPLEVETLIATDLASEGLDLQDADAMVHYDLPWTPERLTQRLGRIARLGSRNRRATVFWFLPPVAADRRLQLGDRLDAKATRQLHLPVPSTSRVGKARVANRLLTTHSRLTEHASRTPAERSDRYRFAVVCGPPAVAAAVRWKLGDIEIPQVMVVAGSPPADVPDVAMQDQLIRRLERGDPIERRPPECLVRVLFEIIHDRLRATATGPTDGWSRRLRRSVLAAAWSAGKQRNVDRVDRLDTVLDRLHHGTRIGAALDLWDLLRQPVAEKGLDHWLRAWPVGRAGPGTIRLTALLFGAGDYA